MAISFYVDRWLRPAPKKVTCRSVITERQQHLAPVWVRLWNHGYRLSSTSQHATNTRQRSVFLLFLRHSHSHSAPSVPRPKATVFNLFHSWSHLILTGPWYAAAAAAAMTGCRQASTHLSRQTEQSNDGEAEKRLSFHYAIPDEDEQSERAQPKS